MFKAWLNDKIYQKITCQLQALQELLIFFVTSIYFH